MQTPNQKEYTKERQRILRLLNKVVPQELQLDLNTYLPTKPKRITQKQINELKKIKKKDVLKVTKPENIYTELVGNIFNTHKIDIHTGRTHGSLTDDTEVHSRIYKEKKKYKYPYKRLTEEQKQRNKAQRHIEALANQAEKRGYIIDRDIVQQAFSHMSPSQIMSLKEKDINPYLSFLDKETGEIISYRERIRRVASKNLEVAREVTGLRRETADILDTDIVSSSFYELIAQRAIDYADKYSRVEAFSGAKIIKAFLSRQAERLSYDKLGQVLNKAQEHGIVISYEVLYNKDEAMAYQSDIIDLLRELGMEETTVEHVTDSVYMEVDEDEKMPWE